jgi:hypothetical protein
VSHPHAAAGSEFNPRKAVLRSNMSSTRNTTAHKEVSRAQRRAPKKIGFKRATPPANQIPNGLKTAISKIKKKPGYMQRDRLRRRLYVHYALSIPCDDPESKLRSSNIDYMREEVECDTKVNVVFKLPK